MKPVQIFLLIAALAGVFLLGRCSQPEPVKEPIPVEQQVPSEPPAENKEPVQPESDSALDEIKTESEADSSPVSITETAGTTGITETAEIAEVVEQGEIRFDEQCRDIQLDGQHFVFPFLHPAEVVTSYVVPEQKENLPRPVVLLKPLRKKKRIAPPGRSVQEYFPDILGGADQATCEGGLVPAMRGTVAALEARSILYGIGPLSDCSGIFHRVLRGVKRRCPNHAYPSPQQYRDSRDLARWYHKQGELILIRNPLERPDLIRPGMVFFFGQSGAVYKNFTVKSLLARRRGIRHVGVVTRVHKDTSGKIISYDLFHGHGRRGKTAASITRWHKRTPTRAGYPPFGNGREQLVAAARLVRP